MESLTIGIIGYNDSENLQKLLEKIESSDSPNNLTIELLYVDDASEDKSQEIFDQHQTRFNKKLINNNNNRGRPFSRNQIILNSSCDWILFLNSNILPKNDNFLLNILSDFPSDCIAMMYPINYSSSDKKMEKYLNNSIRGVNQYSDKQIIHYKYLLFSCALIRSSVFSKNKNLIFNENMNSYGGEELDLAERIDLKYPNQIYCKKDVVFLRKDHPGLGSHIKRLVAFGKYNFNSLSLKNKTLIIHPVFIKKTISSIIKPLVVGLRFLFILIYKVSPVLFPHLVRGIWWCSILIGYYSTKKN